MSAKMTPEKAKKVFSAVFFAHPLPLGTRVLCKDKRFIGGYVMGTVKDYCQGWRYYAKSHRINLRKPWCYRLNRLGYYFPLYKRPETVVKVY